MQTQVRDLEVVGYTIDHNYTGYGVNRTVKGYVKIGKREWAYRVWIEIVGTFTTEEAAREFVSKK